MSEDVIISVLGTRKDLNEEEESIELVTAGKMEKTSQGYTVRYQESDGSGLDQTETIIEVLPEKVILERRGSVRSLMIFQQGRTHLSAYEMSLGTISVGVGTKRLKSVESKAGVEIYIEYVSELEHAVVSENSFRIEVKRKPHAGILS